MRKSLNFKLLAIKATRIILKVFYILPIRENTIYLESLNGKEFSGSAKSIASFIVNNEKPYNLICGLKEPDEYIIFEGVRKVRVGTIKWIINMLTSKYIIMDMRPHSYIPKRKDQIWIETWHAGGAYKNVSDESKSYDSSRKEIIKWFQ